MEHSFYVLRIQAHTTSATSKTQIQGLRPEYKVCTNTIGNGVLEVRTDLQQEASDFKLQTSEQVQCSNAAPIAGMSEQSHNTTRKCFKGHAQDIAHHLTTWLPQHHNPSMSNLLNRSACMVQVPCSIHQHLSHPYWNSQHMNP
eukprot:5363333-Amphidinium_carterae.1